MKAGKISFTVLAPDGVKPISGVALTVQTPDGKSVGSQARTNDKGEAELDLPAGTYVLLVGGTAVTQLAIAADAQTTHLRLVTPAVDASTAGSDAVTPAEEEDRRRAGWLWFGKDRLVTAVIIGGAIATGVIIANNNDDDDNPSAAELRRRALLKIRPNASAALVARFEAMSDAEFAAFQALDDAQKGAFADRLLGGSSRPSAPPPAKPKPTPQPPPVST
jgi:hypothetical protein